MLRSNPEVLWAHACSVSLVLFLLTHTVICRQPFDDAVSGTDAVRFQKNDQLYQRFADLVVPYGYPLEQYQAITTDGYVLRLLRIPSSPLAMNVSQFSAGPASSAASSSGATTASAPRPVVFLQHGLTSAGTAFLLTGPGRCLALLLADEGYDVWMGNARGNEFSKTHVSLSNTNSDYWKFYWDEMAKFDLPASIKTAMEIAGVDHVSYVGHSQGSTSLMAGLAGETDGFLKRSIRCAVLMAPVAFLTNLNSPVMNKLANLDALEGLRFLGVDEFLPANSAFSSLAGSLCKQRPLACDSITAAICGFNADNIDKSNIPIFLKYSNSGTSVQNMGHWGQAIRASQPNVLSKFDYSKTCSPPISGFFHKLAAFTHHLLFGEHASDLNEESSCNIQHYGQPDAPVYRLSTITTPLALFTGGQDQLVSSVDLEYLITALPASTVVLHHHEPTYGHLDFNWADNAHTLIFPPLLEFLRKNGTA